MDHGERGSYLVDIFRAGGGTRREYVFHGPGNSYEVEGPSLAPLQSDVLSDGEFPLENLQEATGESPWSIRWELPGEYEFRALAPGQPGETVVLGDGWGQRDHRNTDRGATLPYVIRRRTGEESSEVFVTVFAGNPLDQRLVESTRLVTIRGGDAPNAVAVAVKTAEGTDLIVSQLEPGSLHVAFGGDDVTTDGRLTAIVAQGDSPSRVCLLEGSRLEASGVKLDLPVASFRGDILDVGGDHGQSYFVVEGNLPTNSDLAGHTLFAIDGDFRRAYPIVAIEEVEGRTRVFTKRGGRGFEARPAERWELPVTVELELAK